MKSFSELTSASQVNNADLLAISQSTGNGYASKKTTIGDVTKGVYASNGVMGAKNLNSTPYYYESQTSNGITWTVNSDGTVTANGTATAQSTFLCHARNQADKSLTLPNGNYILSGCASGGADNKYYIVIGRTYNSAYQGLASDYGSGANVTLNGDDYSANEVRLHFAIVVRNGVTVSNITFKPMIRLASDSDATFQPYAMTNLELTKAIESGGGTGGHTIIDENGNSMTARSGLQFVGGVNVADDGTNDKTIVDLASAGGIDGVFIDTSNVIQAWTTFTTETTYTATEDCIVVGGISTTTGKTATISVDGSVVYSHYSQNGDQSIEVPIRLKKGQTILLHNETNWANINGYVVYGIQTGTTHSKFQPVIYSTEERVIGVWTDGKPLYEKTFIYSNIASLGNGAVFQTDLSNIDNGFVIGGKITEGTTEYVFPYVANNKGLGFKFEKSNNTFIAQGNDTFSNANLVIVIQYTKTTDTAGSGTWTPQGVPAHHYSTNEQIVGTWIDGSTLYEKTLAIPSLSAGSNTIQHNIANFDKMISCQGRINYDGDDLVIPYMQTQVSSGFIAYGIGISNFNSTRYFIILGNMFDVSKFSGGYVTVRYTKSS